MKEENSMKISALALNALVRIVVGCMPPIGKEKRRKNEAHLVSCALRMKDILFFEFRKGLADGTEMYDAIFDFAVALEKTVIDVDVVAKYFGGQNHILKTKKELEDENLFKGSYFYEHTLFAHTLVPVKVEKIYDGGIFSAIYHGANGCLVSIENIRTFSADRIMLRRGKDVLIHFPLLVSCNPKSDLVDALIKEQSESIDFVSCCSLLSAKGLDHDKVKMYVDWINDSVKRYGL